MKKKMQLKWDELQTQAQQMEHVKWPLLVCLTFKMLGIIGILEWGVGFIPQSAWVHLEKDESLLRQFEQVKLPMQSLWKLHGVLKIGYWSPISTTKPKKWMHYPSITFLKSFMATYFHIYIKIVCILTLESFFLFFLLGYMAQRRKLLLQMQFNLHLSIVNYLLIIM